METGEILPGVTAVDHVADVGIEVRAGTLPELFARAALGMMVLIAGEDAGPAAGEAAERRVSVEAADLAVLLVQWLRELLFLYHTAGFVLRKATFDRLDERGLDARVAGVIDRRPATREIKGVTYHALEVARRDAGWFARVIFDV